MLLSEDDIVPAQKLPGCILDGLQRAKDKSVEYAKGETSGDRSLKFYDLENDLGVLRPVTPRDRTELGAEEAEQPCLRRRRPCGRCTTLGTLRRCLIM